MLYYNPLSVFISLPSEWQCIACQRNCKKNFWPSFSILSEKFVSESTHGRNWTSRGMFVFPLQHKFGTHAAKIWKNTHMLSGFRSLSNWKEIYGENRRFFYRPDVLRASIFRAEVGQNRLFPTGRRTSGPYLMIFGPFGLIFDPLSVKIAS